MKSWIVPSQSDPKKDYVVVLNDDGSWSCECPDFRYRKKECKHIYAIKISFSAVKPGEAPRLGDVEAEKLSHSGMLEAKLDVSRQDEIEYVEHPMVKKGSIEKRDYQVEIVGDILSSGNCLVVLPTALGKTIIAELAAAELLHRHPGCRVLVMAPTKPLAMQHRESFLKHLNIEPQEAGLATGEVNQELREAIWSNLGIRCVFATPQTVWSDYTRGKVRLEEFALIVFDECHRSKSKYAYTRIAGEYVRKCPWPRILALTASPGSEEEKVLEVVRNLYIEKIIWRTEEDVIDYIPGVDVKWVRLQLPDQYQAVRNIIKSMIELRARKLYEAGRLRAPQESLNRKVFVSLMNRLRAEIDSGVKGANMHYMAICSEILSLYHAMELIESQHVYSLKKYLERILRSDLRSHKALSKSVDFEKLIEFLKNIEAVDHPKLEVLPVLIDQHLRAHPRDRIMVFANIRDTAEKIVEKLREKGFKARMFVGKGGEHGPGMSQEEQIKILNSFKRGEFNIIVATSIGEEGLDIPECGYVVFYEPAVSGIRYIQRRGRTGRRLPGKVTILVAEKTVDEYYHREGYRRAKKMEKILKSISERLEDFIVKRSGPEPKPGEPWPWKRSEAVEILEEHGESAEVIEESKKKKEVEKEEGKISFRDINNCYKSAYILLLKAGAKGMSMAELMEELSDFEPAVINKAVGRLINRSLVVKSGNRYYLKAALRSLRPKHGELYIIEVEKIYPGFAVVLVNDSFRAKLESWAYYGPRELLKRGKRLKVKATLKRDGGVMTMIVHDVVGVEL